MVIIVWNNLRIGVCVIMFNNNNTTNLQMKEKYDMLHDQLEEEVLFLRRLLNYGKDKFDDSLLYALVKELNKIERLI